MSIANIIKEGSKCYISFSGKTQEEYCSYVKKILYIKNKVWINIRGAWQCGIEAYDFINTLFSNSVQLEDIGKDLKYEPYIYQKQMIYDILNHKELLLVSPCGSGKTIVGIGAFLELKKHNLINKHSIGIILVKATLKIQWQKEIEKFSDFKANVIKSYADCGISYNNRIKRLKSKLKQLNQVDDKKQIKELRKTIKQIEQEREFAFNEQFKNQDLLILNYEALKDKNISEKLKSLNIEYIFADEVHKISNRTTQLSKSAYIFNYIKYKIGATATAISNNPENIFGIYNFISPNLFPSYSSFSKSFVKYAGYGRVVGVKNESLLAAKYSNNITVFTKEEVSKYLPSLTVIQQYCEMTAEQSEMNDKILEELKEAKDKEFEISSKAKDQKELEENDDYQGITARIMMLQTFAQELCDDPRLLLNSKSEYALKYALHDNTSPKMNYMLELVSSILDSNEKVVIISRYVNMLNLIQEELSKNFRNIKIAKVTGSMSDKERYDNIYTKFRDTEEYKILLMSDAGSTGTNASKAQYIIEYDLAESYATQTQRHGRIERADSIHKNVFVYQLIAKNSYDEIQQLIINKKEAYDSNLIQVFANQGN